MSKNDVVRAWKDPKYRQRLSAARKAALPPNPAGAVELTDEQLGQVSGGVPYPTGACTWRKTCDCQTTPTIVC
jgi:mersacidin/lichenicidin family type 2 lantibiotic